MHARLCRSPQRKRAELQEKAAEVVGDAKRKVKAVMSELDKKVSRAIAGAGGPDSERQARCCRARSKQAQSRTACLGHMCLLAPRLQSLSAA